MDISINEYTNILHSDSIEETSSDISDISEISEIEDLKKIFEVKIPEICDFNCDYISDCSSESSCETYDTFDTSDPDILKKQEIKMELLIGKKMLKPDDKNDFNILFKKLLCELKNNSQQIVVSNCNSDSSSEYYLHGYKFF
jgi:hypothetical protein